MICFLMFIIGCLLIKMSNLNKEIKIYNTNNIEAFEQILDDNLKK